VARIVSSWRGLAAQNRELQERLEKEERRRWRAEDEG
jgi:hypothetical protein